MTSDANAIVGNASGIGLKAYNNKEQVGSILVKEKGSQFHYYTLPSSTSTNNDNALPTTTTSNDNSNLSLDEEFQWTEKAEHQLQKIEEEYKNKSQQTDQDENL